MNESADDVIPEAEVPSPLPKPPPLQSLRKSRSFLTVAAAFFTLLLLACLIFTTLKSLLLAVLPFASVVVLGLVGLGTVVFKDWNNYKPRWVRWVLVMLVVAAGFGGIGSQMVQSHEKAAAAALNQANIKGLKEQVAAAQEAQDDSTRQFLRSLQTLSDKVSVLQTKAATEELRTELGTVKGELQRTQAALAPPPKANLTFTFAPFPNPPPGQPIAPVTVTTLPVEADGSVKVRFSVLNSTDVDAVDGELNLRICDQCKFAKEPVGFTKLEGMDDRERFIAFERILALVVFRTLTAEVIAPAHVENFEFGFVYRCRTCVVNKAASAGIVHVRRSR